MVIGDAVSGIGGDNAGLDFQPAAGVEVVIKSCFINTGINAPRIFDGVIQSDIFRYGNTAINNANLSLVGGIFISNAIYLRLNASGVGFRNGFTGIEVQ